MTTSIKEVARHAGVSLGTVSNVLNRPDLVAAATRQRVLDAIADAGLRPQRLRPPTARRPQPHRRASWCWTWPTRSSPTWSAAPRRRSRRRRGGRGLQQRRGRRPRAPPPGAAGGAAGARRAHHAGRRSPGLPAGAAHRPRHAGGAGGPRLGPARPVLGRRRRRARRPPRRGRTCWTRATTASPSSAARSTIAQVADRHAGAAAALPPAAPPSCGSPPPPNLTVAAGRRRRRDRRPARPASRPTAVFCANDLLALGVLQELTPRGMRVPDDVAIVGYDDIEFAAAAAVPLSSVRQPRDQLGRTAAAAAAGGGRGEPARHEHRHVVFQPELVVRASSATARPPAGTGSRATKRTAVR